MRPTLIIPQLYSGGLVLDMPLTGSVCSGTTIRDETGGGFDGTASATLTPKYPGFDFVSANSDYVDIGTGPTSVLTTTLWVKLDDISGNEYPIDLNGSAYLQIANGAVTATGFTAETVYVNGAAGVNGVTTIDTNWNHIAIVANTINASDLDIGRLNANYTDGIIAEVRLYNRTLTAQEIKSLYELTKWRYKT